MRASVALLALVCTSTVVCAQQPAVTLTWHWKNMATDAQTPLHPGQSAAIWLDVSFSPPIGQALPDGRIVRGFAAMFISLAAASDVLGSWVVSGTGPAAFPGTPEIDGPGTNVPMGWEPGDPVVPLHWGRRHDPALPGDGWALGSDALYIPGGDPILPPGTLAWLQAGQWPSGLSVNATNPIGEIWRGLFTPQNYAARDLVWQAQPGHHHSGIVLFVSPPAGSTLEALTLDVQQVNHGMLNIPVVPSPSSLMTIGLGGMGAMRRRRRASDANHPSLAIRTPSRSLR